ncbi:MAG: ISAs1 family transposase [Nitrospirae bacterium]|nr:MAG: ISAs1 family transposase [Nitrospirota bacterium]
MSFLRHWLFSLPLCYPFPVKDDLTLRLVRDNEIDLWQYYMRKYHPLGLPEGKPLPGELLRYVATKGDRWVALLAWSSAALKCAPRDRFIGWPEPIRIKNLKYVTNNVRFVVLPWGRIKNLASRVLSMNLKRLSRDYEQVYGHPVYLAETFVDLSVYKGSCYKAANFIYLGQTKGFSKNGRYYYPNGRPKAVFVYPLIRDAAKVLNGEILQEGGDMNTYKVMKEFPVESLVDVIKGMTDPRDKKGVRYPFYSLVSLSICAVLCGARSFRAIGEWVKNLSVQTLRRFGIQRGTAPDESTIRRVLQRIDVEEFDRAIWQWLRDSGIDLRGKAIAIDGKTMRGSFDEDGRAVHILSAVVHKDGVVISSRRVSDRTNEIKEVKPLLEGLEIEGLVVTGDALLTQREIASYIVEDKGADYVFTVKGNQRGLLRDVEDYFKMETFPPSAQDNR